jgi:hypothetical protein
MHGRTVGQTHLRISDDACRSRTTEPCRHPCNQDVQFDATTAAIGSDRKGRWSLVLYMVGVVLSYVQPWLGFPVYIGVAVIWFIPDSRIENRLTHEGPTNVN